MHVLPALVCVLIASPLKSISNLLRIETIWLGTAMLAPSPGSTAERRRRSIIYPSYLPNEQTNLDFEESVNVRRVKWQQGFPWTCKDGKPENLQHLVLSTIPSPKSCLLQSIHLDGSAWKAIVARLGKTRNDFDGVVGATS